AGRPRPPASPLALRCRDGRPPATRAPAPPPALPPPRPTAAALPPAPPPTHCSRPRVSPGKRRHLSPEALLYPTCERRRVRQPESAGELRRRQAARQLQQRKRVPPRLGDDPVAHTVVQRPTDHRAQQRTRIALTQTLHDELRQSFKLV